MAKHLVDDENGNILGGNFFCTRQPKETRKQENIIPTIVYQLARKSKPYAQALLKADEFISVGNTLSSQMKDLLVGPWQRSISERHFHVPLYLVIVDALDEVDDQGGSAFLKELLNTIDAAALPGLKFLVTSRPYPNIARVASFAPVAVCRLYDMPMVTVQADIMTYLKAELPAFKDHEGLTKITNMADGLFIYAATVVRYITPRPNMAESEQRFLMDKLFNGISPVTKSLWSLMDNLYEHILSAAFSDLDDDMLRIRLNILHTILCTQERVSTSVVAALQSGSDDMRELADVLVKDLHAVLYLKDGCIFWYHASFCDFIFTQARSKFISPSNHVVDMSCDMPCPSRSILL